MSLNMKSLTQAFAKATSVIEKTVQTTVQDVTGPKPLQDYDLLTQIGSAGPGLVWKLYSGKPRDSTRTPYPTVCVWVLDKRNLAELRGRAGLTKSAEEAFFEVVRRDAGRLVRLRHPGVVHVVQGLDESKNAMAFVTEPLFASVGNAVGWLGDFGGSVVPNELKGMEMGLLEVKHGLLQIAESLDFLHNNARLIHRAISPENILITANGSWKLGGFGFAVSAEEASGDMANMPAFHYAEYDVEDSLLPLQPSLNYTAPELVRSRSPSAGYYSDVFSFGCLAYHLIARKPLFDCHNNVKMYMNTLNYLSSESFSSIPSELVPDLQRMLSMNESFRPTAMDFTGSPFFRNDTRLRALRFLDHMLERDNMQKSEFLKALSDMWKDFDSRVLRYKVLPPLCAELRNSVMQPMILPMVLTIAESQDKSDFELSTLPALVPVLSTAAGETLLLLVKHAELIITKASQEHVISHVLPLLVRAYGDTDARIQEEVLKKSAFIAKQLDIQLVKQVILPRVHGLALKTTVAAVRVNALLCLGELVHKLDKHAVLDILQIIQRCTAVDRSAPTLMCTLGVASAILKQYGVEFVAEHVLPLLAPLLTVQQLNVQQFAKYMLFVKDILRKIEEKRGVTVTESGIPEVKPSASVNVLQSQAISKPSESVASATSNRPAWDEDWGSIKGPTTSSKTTTSVPIKSPPLTSQLTQVKPQPESSFSATSPDQVAVTCAPVDIEWPPRASSDLAQQQSGSDKQLNVGRSATLSFDELDPFADWPPRSNGSLSGTGTVKNGFVGPPTNNVGSRMSTANSSNFQMNSSDSWLLGGQGPVEPMRHSRGNSTTNTGSPYNGGSSKNSLGYIKQNQGSVGPDTSYGSKRSTDLESIFSYSKSEQTAPRLAPPPSMAVGRGRGRGRVTASASRSNQVKSSSEQPPLLDLL